MARKNIEGRAYLDHKEHNKITRVAEADWACASGCRRCGWEPVPVGFLFHRSITMLEMTTPLTYYEEDGCDSRAAYIQNNEGVGDSPAAVV